MGVKVNGTWRVLPGPSRKDSDGKASEAAGPKCGELPRRQKILNELFDISFFSHQDYVERYTDYLNTVLRKQWDDDIMRKYNLWKAAEKTDKQELNFYERMNIDSLIR